MLDISSGHTFALSDFGTGTVFGAEVRPHQQHFLMSYIISGYLADAELL